MNMKSKLPTYLKLEDYSDGYDFIAKYILGCDIDSISEEVIVAPNWKVNIFNDCTNSIKPLFENKVYNIRFREKEVTFIRSGIGSPQTGDMVLSLGFTKCKRIIVTGSCGGLNNHMNIGDLVVVNRAFSGEGFSRYLDENILPVDHFYKPFETNERLTNELHSAAKKYCDSNQIQLFIGDVFTTDSILGQFQRLCHITNNLSCIGIEMEMSAAIAAADKVGIDITALLQISDVIPTGKSLLNVRPKEELERRKYIKNKLIAKILLETLSV